MMDGIGPAHVFIFLVFTMGILIFARRVWLAVLRFLARQLRKGGPA